MAPQDSALNERERDMSNGLTQVKQVATNEGERFTAPRPTFNAPTNAEHITPKVRDNAPAVSLVEQAKQSGDEKLAAIFATAEAKAKAAFERAKAQKEGRALPKVTRARKAKKAQTPGIIPVQFSSEDVCGPEDFIKRTRGGDYHTPEMKRLFYANGGEVYLKAGLSYANAFSNLRTDMMKRIKK
jgi:hypothetical protein